MSDVNISSVASNQLLTYNGLTSKWVNFNKPSYTINEQTDFNNSITKNNGDYMIYNSSTNKWEPTTVQAEVLNVFNGYCNIATITLTNIGGFIPLFVAATGYIVENFGDAFTVLSSTQLRVNRTNKYSLNMSWQPSSNQSNLRIYINGVLRIYSGWGEANPTSSINSILSLNQNDIITINNDDGVNENAVNICWFIREIQLNKKIVNTTVDLSTSIELLSDTNIINKQNNDILIYDSNSSKWINKPSGFTPSYWRTYSITSGVVNVQPSAPVNWNGVNLVYWVFDNI